MSFCRIAQITDLHIADEGAHIFDLVDTVRATERVVEQVNALDPQPDVVLVTGDITDAGGEDAAFLAISILQKLKAPYRIANGNHDCRKALADSLKLSSERVVLDGFVNVAIFSGVRFIGLDTAVDDPRSSEISQRQLDYLQFSLSQDQDTPTVIYMHHPPFDTGVSWLDHMKPEKGRHEFGALLQSHPKIQCVCCGHLHRPMRGFWYGVPVFCAPSVMNPVDFVAAKEGETATLKVSSPPGFLVLDIIGNQDIHASLRFLDGHVEGWQYACDDPANTGEG